MNTWTVTDVYLIPDIGHIIGKLSGMFWFSIVDAKSGYHQCPLSKFAQSILAMITLEGIFKYKVLPFGPKNAPAYFQRVMEDVLKEGLNIFCMVYIDDIIVFSKTFEEHILHLESVFRML